MRAISMTGSTTKTTIRCLLTCTVDENKEKYLARPGSYSLLIITPLFMFLCVHTRLVYQDETCKQLTPMEDAGDVEDRRGGGSWQSPRRVFFCPTSLGNCTNTNNSQLLSKRVYFCNYLHIFICTAMVREKVILPPGVSQETVQARRLPEDSCALTPCTSSGKQHQD